MLQTNCITRPGGARALGVITNQWAERAVGRCGREQHPVASGSQRTQAITVDLDRRLPRAIRVAHGS
jgi:hypothetical protein